MSLIQCDYYYHVKSTLGGTPKTSSGVSLACSKDGVQFYIAYVGQQGQKVWWMTQSKPILNPKSVVGEWDNEQIKIDGQFPLTSLTKPAILVFKGQPTIVSIDYNGLAIRVSSFDGTQWSTSSSTPVIGANAVCAIVVDRRLFIFYTAGGSIWQLTITDSPLLVSGATIQRYVGGSNGNPTWAWSLEVCQKLNEPFKVFLFAVPWKKGDPTYFYFDPRHDESPPPQRIETPEFAPLFTRFATVALTYGTIATYVYLAQKNGSRLVGNDSFQDYTAVPATPLPLGNSNAVSTPATTAITARHYPALLRDTDSPEHVYLAHQGGHSGNIWFGHGPVTE